MNILQIAITVFVVIECLNVLMLYSMPHSKMGNGVGVFNAFHKIQSEEEFKPFVGYLINWVAGTKLIFIMMGIVAVVFGNEQVHLYSAIALIISILSFYWRLFPTIKMLDQQGQISPQGYSKTLNVMILSFLVMFAIAIVVFLLS